MNTFKQSAIEILKKAGTPLRYTEITKLALESGMLETEGATPENTMNAQIVVDIKNKGEGSDFVRIAPGTFALNPNKKEIKETPKIIERELSPVVQNFCWVLRGVFSNGASKNHPLFS